ncbi:MAG TPA: biotin/lipoyl-binding protein, partial [Balneolaceae bacterium]|nr:biotin/lipoyl-binding protein [Balneolaceae bacterium]
MDLKKTALLCFVIIVSGSLLTVLIFYTEPTASRTGATKQTAILVDVEDSEHGTYQPSIRAIGTVVPASDIILSPRVSGQVTALSPAFNPGGYVSEGDTLLKIDPEDYEYTLQQRVGELDQARADLAIEMGL